VEEYIAVEEGDVSSLLEDVQDLPTEEVDLTVFRAQLALREVQACLEEGTHMRGPDGIHVSLGETVLAAYGDDPAATWSFELIPVANGGKESVSFGDVARFLPAIIAARASQAGARA